MNSVPSPESDPGLVQSIRNLTSDVIEYGEARYRLIQAEMRVSMGRFGGVASLGAVAAFLAFVGYLPIVALLTFFLSSAYFEGKLIWPLAIVSLAHFIASGAFAALAWHRWKVTEELNSEKPQTPRFTHT